MRTREDAGLSRALANAGTMKRFANELGITPQALSQWQRVPVNRVVDVERITGIHRSVLRPDVFEATAA